jgi:acyl carrier protein
MKRLVVGYSICAISFLGCARTEQPGQVHDQTEMPLDPNVIAAVAQHTQQKPEGISRKSRLKQDLHMDELDVVGLVMELEQRFKIDIPAKAVDRWNTVGDVADFVTMASPK